MKRLWLFFIIAENNVKEGEKMTKTILISLMVGIAVLVGAWTVKLKIPVGFTCSFIDEAAYSNQKDVKSPINYPVEVGIPVNMYGQMR